MGIVPGVFLSVNLILQRSIRIDRRFGEISAGDIPLSLPLSVGKSLQKEILEKSNFMFHGIDIEKSDLADKGVASFFLTSILK